MINTLVTWQELLVGDNKTEVTAKLAELKTAGKFVENTRIAVENSDGTTSIKRSWVDLAAAQEWIDYITTYNPISAVIVDE